LNGSPGSRLSALQHAIAKHWEVILLLGLAALVYQPWNAPGLPILDFSEFLPKLAAHTSLWDRFAAVARYLASQGRFSPIQYLYMALTWSAVGTQASGWHWSYFAINAAVLLLARSVLLQLGVRRSAALVCVGLWAMMQPFADGWLRPTGETLGLIFIFIALRAALRYASAPDWRRNAIIIALCAAATIFAKEMLVALIPLIWLVTRVERRDDVVRLAPWTERDRFLAIVLAVTVVVALAPVAYVALHAPAGNYASRYGSQRFNFALTLDRLEITLFPGRGRLSTITRLWQDPAWRLLLLLPNLVWLGLIVDGLTTKLARRHLWPVGLGFLWISAGVIAYSPWPGRATFYMIPFGFGMVLIAAHALTWIVERGEIEYRGAVTLATALVLITAIEAGNFMHQHDLRVRLDSAIIKSLSKYPGVTHVVAAVPEPGRPGSWGWARELTEFGQVVNGMHPVRSSDVSCADARRILADTPGTVVLSALEGCGMFAPGTEIDVSVPLRLWPFVWNEQRIGRVAFVATALPRLSE
jgi:hypothetical protein